MSSPPFLLRLEEDLGATSAGSWSEGSLGAETEAGPIWSLVEGTEIVAFDVCWALQASGFLFSISRSIFRTKYFPYCDPARFCSWEESDLAIFSCSEVVFSVRCPVRTAVHTYLEIRVGSRPHPVTNPAADPIVHEFMEMAHESQHEFILRPVRDSRRFKDRVEDTRTRWMVGHRNQVGDRERIYTVVHVFRTCIVPREQSVDTPIKQRGVMRGCHAHHRTHQQGTLCLRLDHTRLPVRETLGPFLSSQGLACILWGRLFRLDPILLRDNRQTRLNEEFGVSTEIVVRCRTQGASNSRSSGVLSSNAEHTA